MRFDPSQPLGDGFLEEVQARLDHFFDTQHDLLSMTGDRLDLIWNQARHFAQGGKRLRPAFCYWGYVAAAQDDDPPLAIMDIAASLDLLHLFALVHDDLIDASDTRRGSPSAHRYYEAHHHNMGWQGDSEDFGRSAAILLGDMLFTGSASMVEQASISPERLTKARPYLNAVRSEVLAGQVLDLLHQAKPIDLVDLLDDARLIMELKTAKYTVARPVQVGAALGLASDDIQQSLGLFGAHVGYAFQMRDDLLGIFGDPRLTGKPIGDDLRAGKKTILIGYALHGASSADAARLMQMLGDPGLTETDIVEARRILIESGARESTERAILEEAETGIQHLRGLDLSANGVTALMELVHAAVERTT